MNVPAIPVAGGTPTPFSVARVCSGPEVTEGWLDEMAFGLTESGWVSQMISQQLPAELLEALHSEVQTLHRRRVMKSAGVGRGTDHSLDLAVRRDRIAWLEGRSEPQQVLFSVLEQIRMGLNQRLFLGLRRFETHYATYEPGAFYRKHIDSFRGRASRVVSLVLYLNDNWQASEGGELQVYSRENTKEICGTVRPDAGRVVLFMSEEVPHEVLTARRTRHSLACWFRQDEVPIPL